MIKWYHEPERNMDLKKASDEALMALIKEDHRYAFVELYHRYSSRMLHFFYRMLGGNEDKSQDFFQDLFLKIIENRHRFKDNKKFSTWIYTIAHNMCKNEYRRINNLKEQPLSKFHEKFTISDAPVEEKLEKEELKALIEQALMTLDPIQREIILMRFQEEMSIREISHIVGCSEGTVKSRLFYSIQKISKQIKSISSYID